MNRINIVFILIVLALGIKAQDTIKFVDGNLIAVKVLEISPETVKYKQANYLDGPDYIEDKSKISFIKYKNGTVDSIKAIKKPELKQTEFVNIKPTYNTSTTSYLKINQVGAKYYFVYPQGEGSTKALSINRIVKTLDRYSKENNSPDLKLLLTKTRKNRVLQTVFGISGAPLVVVGAASGMFSMLLYSTATEQYDLDAAKSLGVFAAVVATAGISFEITSLVNNSRKKQRLREAIKLYNSKL